MLYIIPNYLEAERWAEKAEKLGAAFEYNEFFRPEILQDRELFRRIIGVYKDLGRDRSKDTLHGAFFDMVINSMDPMIKQTTSFRFHQCMEAASELGCKSVIFHTNYIVGFKSFKYRDKWVEDSAVFYRNLLKEYPGISIYVENMFDDTPELLKRLAIMLADEPRFGVCFDIAHAYLWDLPLDYWVEELGPYIKHLHLNDNNRDEDSHLAIGEGSLPWEILKNEKLYINDPSVLVEIKGEEKLNRSIAYLKEKGLLR